MTKDLARLVGGDTPFLTTSEYTDAVAEGLQVATAR
jgi:isocitrate dehydrogenase